MRLADHVHGQARTKQGRQGKKPIWFVCRNESQGVRESVDWLKRVTEKYPQKTTAVVCATIEEAKHVMSLLEPTFGMMLNLNSNDGFANYDGISVTYVGAVKGLEFSNVLIWNPSRKSYSSLDLGRNALYTAITRAAELLCIVTWGRYSRLLPYHRSNLVRAHVINDENEN
jgi:DNA helicase IV